MIQVSYLIHKRATQSDLRIAYLMSQKIYTMYCNVKKKEETNVTMLLTSMLEHEQYNKVNN